MKQLLSILGVLMLAFAVALPATARTYYDDYEDDEYSHYGCLELSYNLRQGSRDRDTDDEVTLLQEFLYDNDYLDSEPTGYFGRATYRALREFQSDYDLRVTGQLNDETREAIEDETCDGDYDDNYNRPNSRWYGDLQLYVYDRDNGCSYNTCDEVREARVTVRTLSGLLVGNYRTNNLGVVRIEDLYLGAPTGRYQITVKASGYDTATRVVTVRERQVSYENFGLND